MKKDWETLKTYDFNTPTDQPKLTKGEEEALKTLMSDSSIIIKPADKGNAIIIMNRNQYLKEVLRQLNNQEFYQKLTKPIYTEYIPMIHRLIETLLKQRYINKKQATHPTSQETQRPRRFYILPKIHKNKTTWHFPDIPSGRPIVSDCNSESYSISVYIDNYLNHISNKHYSYIKYTYDFLEKIKNLKIEHTSKLFTKDINNLFTNIEMEMGLKAIKKYFN